MMTETKLTIREIKRYENVDHVPNFIDLGLDAMKEFGIQNARIMQPYDSASGSTDFGVLFLRFLR